MKIKVISPGASGLSVGTHKVDSLTALMHMDIANGITAVVPDSKPVPAPAPAPTVTTPPIPVVAPVKKAPVMPDYESMKYNDLRKLAAEADIKLSITADKEKYVTALERKWKKDNA